MAQVKEYKQDRPMERWAVYGKHKKKWLPLFKDERTFKTFKYAKKVADDVNRGSHLTNSRLEVKVVAVLLTHCPTCGKASHD